jgi:long-subunit acyl-CoA synthetase (AMP-forming)
LLDLPLSEKRGASYAADYCERAHGKRPSISGSSYYQAQTSKRRFFTDLTWSELHEMAAALCAGLIDQGLEPGDRVALLSYNRLEWIVADLAVLMAGGVDVPIYHTNTAEQCQYIIKDAGAKFVVVEDQVQLEKVASWM